jgi:hypothetical protein
MGDQEDKEKEEEEDGFVEGKWEKYWGSFRHLEIECVVLGSI